MQLWMVFLSFPLLVVNRAEDEAPTESCNEPLGLSSRLEDSSITTEVEGESNPSQGRLGKTDGAWCFNNDSISSGTAVLMVDLSQQMFISGIASQGPPVALQPKDYNHVVGFSAAFSLDSNQWTIFNGGNLFFSADKNDTIDVISYSTISTIELAQYVKINVMMQVSGSTTICLRFELYGCKTAFQPSTGMQATTTPKGKIDVKWNQPYAEITLESETPAVGVFNPNGYVVSYRPVNSKTFATAATSDRTLSLEDVRLGAKYVVQLQCLVKEVTMSCGSTEIEAYPPCPEDWTGGNEYHCFLYLSEVSDFLEARTTCLSSEVDDKLGKLSSFVDDDEKKFLADRILPKEANQFWFIRDVCQENEDCCNILKLEGGKLQEYECGKEKLSSAVCLRDHKGEGARLLVSSLKASDDGKVAKVEWRYEGIGWKTDKLQAKLWSETTSKTLMFSTLEPIFTIDDLAQDVMYSLILKPAPNIRTEEYVHKFIIIDFTEEPGRYGAFLTPIDLSVYVIWSGTLKITWEEGKAYSVAGSDKVSEKYLISHQTSTLGTEPTDIIVEEGTEYLLTPLDMGMTYVFQLGCYFVGKAHPCGSVSVKTDPPKHIIRQPTGSYLIYEIIDDSKKNWMEAEEDCLQRSGHLVSLLTDSEGKTLLQMLPDKSTKVWTGAKLGKKATGYWTDGNKITYLPMAKNSGVTPDSTSCCKALRENDKLRLAGSPCSDVLPYICKYLLKEMLASPSSLTVGVQTWNSFEVTWKSPDEGWLPTFYDIAVCSKASTSDCKTYKGDKKSTLSVENLLEFTEYDVTLEAVFNPIDITTNAKISAYTYPKTPIRYNISTNGTLFVETPMLVALGRNEAEVTVTLSQNDVEVTSVSGDTKSVLLTGLAPAETYKLIVKESGSDWMEQLDIYSVSSCLSPDKSVGVSCYRIVAEEMEYKAAVSYCKSIPLAQNASARLWMYDKDEVEKIVEGMDLNSNLWIKQENVDSSGIENNECTDGGELCCTYKVSTKEVACTHCCESKPEKQASICSYEITYLSRVSDLRPSFIGNTSFQLEWSKPNDVMWIIRQYAVVVRYMNSETLAYVDSPTFSHEKVDFGSTTIVSIVPYVSEQLKGESVEISITTLDPRPALIVNVQSNGSIIVRRARQTANVNEEVDVAVLEIDPETNQKKAVAIVRGESIRTELKGLKPGAEYLVEMTPVAVKKGDKNFNHSITFKAFPTCGANQIQEDFLCIWPKNTTKTGKEAADMCRKENGELLDYKTQEELTSSTKALLTSFVEKDFWVDVSSAKSSAALVDSRNGECKNAENVPFMCCSYELSPEGLMGELKCTCCDEPRLFACKKEAEVDLGKIGEIVIEEITPTSLTLGWTMEIESNWQSPFFLITWQKVSSDERRRKRSAENYVVVKDTEATVDNLEPGSKYQIAITPYSESPRVEGTSKEINISTGDVVMAASLMQNSGCTVTILKISCCVTVILGTGFTVLVFIATRMLFLDCLTQIFSEISLLGAYLCVLISSSQSYSVDSECMRASPTLCVAVSALIQFFFQAAFLFLLLESLLMCSVLKDYLPTGCLPRSPLSIMVVGFGIPAIMNIILAAIASDEYTDYNDNCWLNLQGRAMLPSVIPVVIFSTLCLFFLLSVFDADDPKEGISEIQQRRGKVFLKMRWSSFVILSFVTISYCTGMMGASNRDSTLNYVFVGFSTSLGILIPVLRIRCDDEVKEQLKRGLFTSLRDDMGGIRVTPAPDEYDSNNPFLNMTDFSSTKYKQQQLMDFRLKKEKSAADQDIAYHR